MRVADWKQRAVELKKQGVSWTKLPEELEREYKKPFDFNKVRYAVRSHPWYKEQQGQTEPADIAEVVMKSLKGGTTRTALCDKTGISKRVLDATLDDIRDAGFLINDDGENVKLCRDVVPQDNSHECEWTGDKIIRFGVVSDTHFGSKFVQITHLHDAYQMFKREGITTVYNPGDLTEGEKMRPGHEYECYIHGADAHIDEVIKNYPKVEGIETQYILGNHDLSFMKHVGLDISRQISRERTDLIALGVEQAYINLTPNCVLEIRHPGGGSAYALSYKIQKMVEAMSGGEKPNIFIVGHFHKMLAMFYRNVHCLLAGTTQAQSNFMRNHNLAAHIGAWIVEIYVDDDGYINRFKPEWFPFYKSIKDDWKNWI